MTDPDTKPTIPWLWPIIIFALFVMLVLWIIDPFGETMDVGPTPEIVEQTEEAVTMDEPVEGEAEADAAEPPMTEGEDAEEAAAE